MPKRVPTPPPSDDEPKYLVIHNPYPLHANIENEKDRIVVSRWISCFIDKNAFFALYYKPSSQNMIIVEIARSCPDIGSALGAHSWGKMLKNPNPGEGVKESRIFYCQYTTGRDVQKTGWKRVDVEESWFRDFNPRDNLSIVFPYPEAHYCSLPAENQTATRLCRSLPVAIFPPQPMTRPPPVGSSQWLEQKQEAPKKASGKKSKARKKAARTREPVGQDLAGSTVVPTSMNSAHVSPKTAPADLPQVADGPVSVSNLSASSGVDPFRFPPPGLPRPPNKSGFNTSVQLHSGLSSDGGDRTPATLVAGQHDDSDRLFMEDLSARMEALDQNDPDSEGVLPITPPAVGSNSNSIFTDPDIVEDEENVELCVKQPATVLCAVHGGVCKRGICSWWKEHEKNLKRQERFANQGTDNDGFRSVGRGRGGRGRGGGRGAPRGSYGKRGRGRGAHTPSTSVGSNISSNSYDYL